MRAGRRRPARDRRRDQPPSRRGARALGPRVRRPGSAPPAVARARAGDRRGRAGWRGSRAPAGVAALGGPGAGSPWTRTRFWYTRWASDPVIFCSRIAGTSASSTAPDRPNRRPGRRRTAASTAGCRGTSASGSSSRPSSASRAFNAVSAPGPHARARTPWGVRSMNRVTGPAAFRVARQADPDASNRSVGSNRPRPWIPRVRRRSRGWSSSRWRSASGDGVVTRRAYWRRSGPIGHAVP